MVRTGKPANLVGPQIKHFRKKLKLTQEQLAAGCQLAGFDISRRTVSQIEARLRCVKDMELRLVSKVLRCKTDDLFQKETGRRK